MRSLKQALPHTISRLGITRRTRQAQALLLWPEVVGPAVAAETIALKLVGATLWIQASSPAMSHQLHLEGELIKERLNRLMGVDAIREIRFRQGARP